jgi:hypothetical protein
MYQIVIYGELFASTWKSILQPELKLPRFDIEMRFEYIRYCIPDVHCANGNFWMEKPEFTGPYAIVDGDYSPLGEDQVALRHVLSHPQWIGVWSKVCCSIGGYFPDLWRQEMWSTVVQCQGLEGLQMITGGVEKWRERLTEIRSQIEKLKEKPKGFKFRPYGHWVSEYPDMYKEVFLFVLG